MYDFGIVGGGIIGLSTALSLIQRYPSASIVVLEKEHGCGLHQTGHNSGVIHSGIYYRPGSLKARLASEGRRRLIQFCREHEIEHELCGKVIVATSTDEVPRLDALYRRGLKNGLELRRLGPRELQEVEPDVEGLAAIWVPEAGIVDFRRVAEAFADLFRARGGELRPSMEVQRIRVRGDAVVAEADGSTVPMRFLINCAGLHSDRIARLAGARTGVRIVPFRGEYFELTSESRGLVRNLVYPVPDPRMPFLGVHLTRMIDGSVRAGPNALFALKREGYGKWEFDPRDAVEALAYPGTWKLALRHWRAGVGELARSFVKRAFVRSLRRLVPALRPEDLAPAGRGIRAQALGRDGRLVDDFVILDGHRSIHVCNAPSPGATACIAIGRVIAGKVPAPHHVLN